MTRGPTFDERVLSEKISREVADTLAEVIGKYDVNDEGVDPSTMACLMNGLQTGFVSTSVGMVATIATFSHDPEGMVRDGIDMLKRHLHKLIDAQVDKAVHFAIDNKEPTNASHTDRPN